MAIKIKTICIDLDNYAKTQKLFDEFVLKTSIRCQKFGIITQSLKTKHGHHIKIKLIRQVSFKRSIEIRHYCHDDNRRIVFDVLRFWNGARMIDTCFDKKVTKK